MNELLPETYKSFHSVPIVSVSLFGYECQYLSMREHGIDFSIVIFGLGLLATFGVVFLGRRDSKNVHSIALADQRLNRWLVGLSAGATANSGFVVTAAVGLGYSFGAQWILLSLSWLLGDLFFWRIFLETYQSSGSRHSCHDHDRCHRP